MADQLNSIAGFSGRPLRGVVSTAAMWLFYEYSRKALVNEESEPREDAKSAKDEDGGDDEGNDEDDYDDDAGGYIFAESPPYAGSKTQLDTVAGHILWLLLQGWCDVQQQHEEIST